MARTQPTLLDLAVALSSGSGTADYSRGIRSADRLPGGKLSQSTERADGSPGDSGGDHPASHPLGTVLDRAVLPAFGRP